MALCCRWGFSSPRGLLQLWGFPVLFFRPQELEEGIDFPVTGTAVLFDSDSFRSAGSGQVSFQCQN